MLWQIEIYPTAGQPDLEAERVAADAADLGIADRLSVRTARGYLLQGSLDRAQVEQLADQLLADRVVERTMVAPVGDSVLADAEEQTGRVIYVLLEPGVMDPVAQSAQMAVEVYDVHVEAVRTFRKYWIGEVGGAAAATLQQTPGQ